MYYKTSGDFIIGGAVIAEQFVRDCNNRKTSNALLFALLWSLSIASSFLHLQLDQETGAGKGPKNSVVSQLSSYI